VYQQQSFHTSNYRGNIQGHDNYLRADSTQPSGTQPGTGYVQSQYRGFERSFQPSGQVQSVYGSSQQTGYATSVPVNATNIGPSSFSGSYGTAQAQSYHTANYRGNQPGHDNYLRADSTNPSQSSFGSGFGSTNSFQPSGYASSTPTMGGSFGSVSSDAYHTSSYRGNQPGHDNYLRADSTSPSSMGSVGYSTIGTPGAFGQSSFGQSQFSQNQFSQNQYQPSQYQPTSAYHSASYRGNQPGHDNYLRADSTNPSQGQFFR
jgi:hypothetical protein